MSKQSEIILYLVCLVDSPLVYLVSLGFPESLLELVIAPYPVFVFGANLSEENDVFCTVGVSQSRLDVLARFFGLLPCEYILVYVEAVVWKKIEFLNWNTSLGTLNKLG